MYSAGGYSNGSPFAVGWVESSNTLSDQGLSIRLNDTPSSGTPYSSGEFRSTARYGYGYYEVVARPVAGEGIMNGTLFSYTGPAEGTAHDEIDIEFAGQDLSILRTNYWVNGVPHEEFIPLGFNAGDAYHTYAYEWLPTGIRWLVDGRIVRTVTASPEIPVPTTPMFVISNLWVGDATAVDWLGDFNYTTELTAQISFLKFTPAPTTQLSDRVLMGIDSSGVSYVLVDQNSTPLTW